MADSLVGRLKTELKRSLRKHVGEAVNNVCSAFADELKPIEPLPPAPTLGSNGSDVDYECCRRLVEYIVQNMETSPGFTHQMDCVILAYQSNASVDVLNSVVTQNLWVRRKGVGGSEGEKKTVSAVGMLPTSLKSVPKKYTDHMEGCSFVVDAKVPNATVEKKDEDDSKTASMTASDIVNNAQVVNKVPVYQNVSPQKKHQVKQKCLPTPDRDLVDSDSGRPPTNVSVPRTTATTGDSLCVKARGHDTTSIVSDSRKSLAKSSVTSASRPREWKKRKRLMTSKRQKVTVALLKQFRETPSQKQQSSDQSSTESDYSEDNKCRVHRQLAGLSVDGAEAAINDMGVKAKNDDLKCAYPIPFEGKTAHQNGDPTNSNTVTATIESMRVGAVTEPTVNVNGGTVHATCSGKMKMATEKDLARPKNITAGEAEEQGLVTTITEAQVDQNIDESLLDLELRNVERDLEAGDEVWGLNVAKARFQSLLDGLVLAEESFESPADRVDMLCDTEMRSVDQTCTFKTRLRDTISIVDALLCKPPRGQCCSRDCKVIRAQLCNEFTPCINPTCRVWHEAEAHNDNCQNEQCEFKARVHLRETLHLIEHKQQEIADARSALQLTSATHFASTRPSDNDKTSVENIKQIETLEQNLGMLNGELIMQIDAKLQLWSKLNSIGIDTNSDEIDRFPDFSSHYTPRSNKRN